MARNISYDSNQMQTPYIFSSEIDDASIPTKSAKMYALAHYSGSKIPFVSYSDKKIMVTGTLIGDTVPDLDARIDSFKSFFINQDRNLDIDFAGSTRRYTATANKVDIKRPGGLLYANFSIEFYCTNPFGQAVNTDTALNATGRTLASYSDSYTFLGTAPTQRPIITITLTAVTQTGVQPINFGNNANGQQITVTRTWAVNDVLQIDSVQKLVTVNGFAVDYSGAFPEFKPGAQSLGYSDGLTTRTFSINVVYNQLFL
jgi:hypothetical protein